MDKELYERIAEMSLDAIVSIGEAGKIEFWNAAAERMFGFSRQEALGMNIAAIIPPERCHELPHGYSWGFGLRFGSRPMYNSDRQP